MKRTTFMLVFVLSLVFSVVSVHAEQKITTIGNSSYINLRSSSDFTYSRPNDSVDKILMAVKNFEVSHPNLRVLNWNVDADQGGYASFPAVFGIWIIHESR